MRAGLRRFVAYGAAVLAAAVPAAVVATPAAAIIIPTYGFGWHYDSQTSFTFKAWLPGVELNGIGSDNGTTRTVSGTLADKVVDGNCAVALGGGENDAGAFWKQTCDDQPPVTFAIRAFTGSLVIKYCSEPVSPPPYGVCIAIKVPSSLGDPGLRSTGTGASWTYAPIASWYAFSLTRPGVHLFGNAYDTNPSATSVGATVQNTASGWTCATGSATQLDEEVGTSVCTAGQQATFSGTLTGASMVLDACSDGILGPPWCIAVKLPATLH